MLSSVLWHSLCSLRNCSSLQLKTHAFLFVQFWWRAIDRKHYLNIITDLHNLQYFIFMYGCDTGIDLTSWKLYRYVLNKISQIQSSQLFPCQCTLIHQQWWKTLLRVLLSCYLGNILNSKNESKMHLQKQVHENKCYAIQFVGNNNYWIICLKNLTLIYSCFWCVYVSKIICQV